MNYNEMIERKLKSKKIIPNKEEVSQERKEEKELNESISNNNSILEKRGDYKDWEENWRLSDNSILEELEELGFELWINEKGEFVLKDIDTQKDEVITPSNINRKISSLLGKKVFISASFFKN